MPVRLGKSIRSELDWIVMKAIEKDRSRRYDTASALASDVERYLAGEPVVAAPPTIAYRFRKFVSRNRVAVTTTTLVALALIIGTVASSFGLVEARSAQHRLELAQGKLKKQLSETGAARQQAEANLYAAEMNRAATAYLEGSVGLALTLLRRHQLTHGNRFEWRLVHHMCMRGDAAHTFHEHTDRVTTLALSQHGLIASGGADRTFRLFDLSRKQVIASRTMPSEIIDVDFTPDGGVLAVAEKNNQITFWDVDSLELLSRLPGQRPKSKHLQFLPDGATLAVAGDPEGNPMQLWTWRAPHVSPVVPEGAAGSYVSVSPKGDMICLARAQNIGFWRETNEGTYNQCADIRLAHDWSVADIAFSRPYGKQIATTEGQAQVRIWDAASIEKAEITRQPKTPLAILRTTAKSLAYSPDGRYLASGDGNGNVEIWRGRPPWTPDEQPLSTMRGHTGAITSIAYSHDGHWIVTGSADHTVKLWPGHARTIDRDTVIAGDWVYAVSFSPDDRKLAAGGFDGRVLVLDAETMEELLNEKRHNHEVFDVAFSADGQWLASCSGKWRYDGTGRKETMGRVSIVNLSERQKDYYVDEVNAEVRGIDFSPLRELLALGDVDGKVRIWNVEQRRTLAQVDTSKVVRNLRYSPDGQLLAIATTSGLELRQAESLELIASSGDHNSRAVQFSPDSQSLAYGVDTRILMFETSELARLTTFEGGPARIWDVAFLPDGQTLATCALDGSVKLWNLETGRDVVSLPAHQGHATGLAVSHDGNILASSGADNSIRIWRANPAATQ